MSRFEQYQKAKKTDLFQFQGELGLSVDTPEDLKKQINRLLEEIDNRLKKTDSS